MLDVIMVMVERLNQYTKHFKRLFFQQLRIAVKYLFCAIMND